MPGRALLSFRSTLVASALLLAAGCASSSGEDNATGGGSALSGSSGGPGIVYFHGMSHLGLAKSAITSQVGGVDLLTPSMSDPQLEAPLTSDVTSFFQGQSSAIASGYSLGRVPVLRLMRAAPPGLSRVVMIDPTYDSATGMPRGSSGSVAKTWLDGSDERSLLFVYGDVTKQLKGSDSYLSALSGEPRAVLCYVPGDHARFRQPDMAYALVAKDCEDLKTHLKAYKVAGDPVGILPVDVPDGSGVMVADANGSGAGAGDDDDGSSDGADGADAGPPSDIQTASIRLDRGLK